MNCTQSTCPGRIVEGYCDHCGLAPSGSQPTIVLMPASTGPGELGPVGWTTDRGALTGADPRLAILPDPHVAEARRFCGSCDGPVGRSHEDVPGRLDGFCTTCGHPFSFTPKLAHGMVVGGQYEVEGCLAHGGLGWIYLARDRNLDGRWVVLKGLLSAGDAHALAVAVAERGFLVEVEHPNIVKVYNFVEHEGAGYLVMEYIAGTTLRATLDARTADGGGGLSHAEALTVVKAALPALGHLHDLGLAYCDFKPENVMQTATTVKLIDLGGVYRMTDSASPIYGTRGFQAPEIAHTGPTVESDVHTVGRTLAVLTGDAIGHASPSGVAGVSWDSFQRLVQRAVHRDPRRRFHSVDEMIDQIDGVLGQSLAVQGAEPRCPVSTVFTAERSGDVGRPDWRMLPVPLVDGSDPSAGFLAALGATDADDLLLQLEGATTRSVEVAYRTVRALLRVERTEDATRELGQIAYARPYDWRVDWYRGVIALVAGQFRDARLSFEDTRDHLPGELAVVSAIALACELAGDLEEASDRYRLVLAADPMRSSAAFGLARCRAGEGDLVDAAHALDRVPDSSPMHVAAQQRRIDLITDERRTAGYDELAGCARIVQTLRCDEDDRLTLEVQILAAARRVVELGVTSGASDLFECPPHDRVLRLGLERRYRDLALHATTAHERHRLVDMANSVRPRSWR